MGKKKRDYSHENEVEHKNKNRLTVKIDKSLDEKFREKLSKENKTASEFIREKIEEYLK